MNRNVLPELILELLFPRRCPVCGEIVEQDREHRRKICPDCYGKIRFVERTERCACCGRRIAPEREERICDNCGQHHFSFQQGLILMDYNDLSQKSMADIKYKGKREYLEFYGEEAAKRFAEEIRSWKIDGLVPVPVHWRRRNKRGYNQAEVLARVIGRELELPVFPEALQRKRTKALKELSADQRRKNLSHAIYAGKLPKTAKSLLIIDDIFTTGATIEVCTASLREAGAERVYSLCLCAKPDMS